MPKWKSNGSYEPCPEGTHAATCVEVLDIGTQETQYGDKPQVVFGFELAEEDSIGRRYFRRRTLTSTLHAKSTTRSFIESMLGRKLTDDELGGNFDDRQLLGAKCAVEIGHVVKDGKVFDNIINVTRLMKGVKCPEPKLPLTYLSLDREQFDEKVFEGLATWLKDKITSSPEYAEMLEPPPPPKPSIHEELNDQVPF